MNSATQTTETLTTWNDRVSRGLCAVCGDPASDDFPCGGCQRRHPDLSKAAIKATRETAHKLVARRCARLRFY